MKKKKKKPQVWCHYGGKWYPLGRAKKKCPHCGAVFMKGDLGHKFK